jgi:hypothetical protein
MESIKQYLIPYIASNIIFGLCIVGAIRKPLWARIFLATLFLWACYFNSATAVKSPEIYLTYSTLAILPVYSKVIDGFFAAHITPLVLTIAAGQFLIALGLVLNKNWTRGACLGGILFGLAIAPLGVGSAFPSSVFMATAFYILLKKYDHDFIWKWGQYNLPQTVSKQHS